MTATFVSHSLKAVRDASRSLATVDREAIDQLLNRIADRVEANSGLLLQANREDLSRMSPEDPKYDRLLLNEARLEGIAAEMRMVAQLSSPLGRVLSDVTLPNGLQVSRVTVPLGVVGVIYEARPNVTYDVCGLCLKSGNAVVLKGGSDARQSNEAAVALIHDVLKEMGLPLGLVHLLPSSREAVDQLLQADDFVDVIIPRGSKELIDSVREKARVPVIETGAGIVHTYVDEGADLVQVAEIIFNAKTRRVSVCNALDTLLVHRAILDDLPGLFAPLGEAGVEIFADPESHKVLEGIYPASLLRLARESDYGVEFLSMKMAVKIVDGLEEAIAHIAVHSSRHSEAILSNDPERIDQFLQKVDAAAVYANASTAFTDGAQFGLGAEIGISTQKLHARGPMGLDELTSYKWVVRGSGQIRP